MALTEIPVELSSTPGIADSSNATAITIDSSENTTFTGDITAIGIKAIESTNGDPVLGHFYNANSGNAAESTVYITNSSTVADGLFLQAYGASATTAGGFVQDSATLGSGTGASGGLSIMTRAAADMRFYTNGHTNERMRITSSAHNHVAIGSSSVTDVTGQWATGAVLDVHDSGSSNTGNIILSNDTTTNDGGIGSLVFANRNNSNAGADTNTVVSAVSASLATSDSNSGDDSGGYLRFLTKLEAGSLSEKMRIDSAGNILINRTNGGFNNDGTLIGNSSGSYMYMERSAGTSNSVLYLHRRDGNGELISFYESNSHEGGITVSGATVSYNGFTGTHDSSGSGVSSSTLVGTVLSTIDEEHKTDHAKVKVSDTASDKRVYGVLQVYKAEETDDTENTKAEHAVVASVGVASVRVTGACAGGDLLESAGNGTAKVQSDDVIRSSTLGKVTIGNSNEEEKLVSCVMYCG